MVLFHVTQDAVGRIQRRATRACDLAAAATASAPLLSFYAQLCEQQRRLLARDVESREMRPPGRSLSEAIDRGAVVSAVHDLLAWLSKAAPSPLADSASAWTSRPPGEWRRRLDALIDRLPDRIDDEREGFVLEAALQPFAEVSAARLLDEDGRITGATGARCPFCGDHPSVAVLREAGHGARRSYVCGLCLTEWPAPRLGCVACGESNFDRLPVFRADELAADRLYAFYG
jgi:formate dehydrogenase maturation protein FdhE